MKNEKVNTKKLCIHVTCFALFSISVIPTSILQLYLVYSGDTDERKDLCICLCFNVTFGGLSELMYFLIIYDLANCVKQITNKLESYQIYNRISQSQSKYSSKSPLSNSNGGSSTTSINEDEVNEPYLSSKFHFNKASQDDEFGNERQNKHQSALISSNETASVSSGVQ